MSKNTLDHYGTAVTIYNLTISVHKINGQCTSDTLCLGGRVALETARVISPMEARAISAVFYNTAPATIQLWAPINETLQTYRLDWQQTIASAGYFGLNIVRVVGPVFLSVGVNVFFTIFLSHICHGGCFFTFRRYCDITVTTMHN